MNAQIKVTMNLSSEFLVKHGNDLPIYGLTRENGSTRFTGPLHRWQSLAEDINSKRLRMLVDEAAKRA